MNDARDSSSKVPQGLLGPVTRREALVGAAAAAGFVTLGLKEALATSRATGKPLFGSDCRALNSLVPAGPGPEYDRLLQEGITDPKGFLTSRFSFTKTQQAALDATTPAEIEAIRGALRTAKQDKLKLHFDCGAPAAGRVLHSSARLQIVSDEGPEERSAALRAQGSGQPGATKIISAPGEHVGITGNTFQGNLTFTSPAIR